MVSILRFSVFFGLILVLSLAAFGSERAAGASDSYDVVLHSQSLADQRAALTEILENPQKYVPRIQQSLRDYPRLLRTDPTAAKRAVYISALLRHPSFPPILVKSLGSPEVLDDCGYACPVVFALTIQAYFGGWKLPTNLDSELTTVGDLKAAIDYMSRITLKAGRIEDVVQGPGLEKHRKQIERKTEDQLIQLAGPMTSSLDTRMFAAFRLETLVSTSKNRIDLYLLALNDFEDGSGEYKGAIYQSIYRAELANVQSPSASKTIDDDIYVGFLDDAREEMVNWKPGVARQRVVRPAFERTNLGWKQVDPSSLPHRIKWTIAFDGRNLGEVESQADGVVGLTVFQRILTSPAAVPSVGPPSDQFAGLMGNPTKVRRPLITVSKPYFQDPDGWKRTKLSVDVVALVRKAFRREFPHIDRCEDEKIAEPNWNFPDSALTLPIAYASNKHSFLVQATLDAGNCGYVDDPDDPLSAPWFFVSPDGVVRRIGSFMSLLDAGDYDNDGQSELVFFLSRGENTDGFALFDATFGKQVTFTWHYH